MSMTRSGLLVSILAVLATGTAACPQTIPDVFNVQPTIIPLERVQLLGIENLRLVRLVTRTSALAHGDSSLSESYQPAARLGIGRYNPLYFELETSPGRVGFIVHKSHAGMLAAHPGAPGVLGPVDPDPDVLRQTQTIVYDHRGDPQYYVLKSGGKVFVMRRERG